MPEPAGPYIELHGADGPIYWPADVRPIIIPCYSSAQLHAPGGGVYEVEETAEQVIALLGVSSAEARVTSLSSAMKQVLISLDFLLARSMPPPRSEMITLLAAMAATLRSAIARADGG